MEFKHLENLVLLFKMMVMLLQLLSAQLVCAINQGSFCVPFVSWVGNIPSC